jgi:hypothetical protein
MTVSPELLHLIGTTNYCLGYCKQRLIDDEEAQAVINVAMEVMNRNLKSILEEKHETDC